MKKNLLAFFLFLLFPFLVSAQLSCQYSLVLSDSYGDGWNEAVLSVTINGNTTDYTLNNVDDDGSLSIIPLTVMDGDTMTLSFLGGLYDYELAYVIIDTDGVLVWTDGPTPQIGTDIFTTIVSCPSCPATPVGSISLDDVRAFHADISWLPSDPDGIYLFEYGAAGFVPGTGQFHESMGASTSLNELEENTDYEFYLSVLCANGDTSIARGPIAFHTLWATDVGIIEVLSPKSGCGLGFMDTIFLRMQNWGGLPQSLIPFNFSLNGIPGGVPQPQDGFYTGVIGTDSIVTIEFETFPFFPTPGDYELTVWTELEGDSVLTNDTTTIHIVNVPIIEAFPYFSDFEEWSNGWTVNEESQNPSWALGQPTGAIINSAVSGDNAWVTNLEGDYNANELSYLDSPCFNFSGLEEDPVINFSLFLTTESCCDELWLEMTIDGGETWERVDTLSNGLNWYNDLPNQWWDGTADMAGWRPVAASLSGMAGAEDARIRFVFSTDGSVYREGVGIDDVYIGPALANDLALFNAAHTSVLECGDPMDSITVNVANLGQPIDSFEIFYLVNGEISATETVLIPLMTNEQIFYTFVNPFNSADTSDFVITASVVPDDYEPNNSVSFSFSTTKHLPFAEDFEAGVFQEGWSSSDFSPFYSAGAHNNPTGVISDNIYSSNTEFELLTPTYGTVETGDLLYFDYRYVDWSVGLDSTILASDSLIVQISVDCGESYTTLYEIDSTNHVATTAFTTIKIGLDDYAGENVKFRFHAGWDDGDYWLDLDNINYVRCAGFDLNPSILNESVAGANDGNIILDPITGFAPFEYLWSTGDTTNAIWNLTSGTYTVSATDVYGCTDEVDILVEIGVVATIEPELIGNVIVMPNPTTGMSLLKVDFTEAVDAHIQVFNLMGQAVSETFEKNVSTAEYQIDLSEEASGLYLIRVMANDKAKVLKLVKTQ